MFRRQIYALLLAALPFSAGAAEDPQALASAIQAANGGQWAVAMGRARTAGPVASDILEWLRLRSTGAEATLPDYMAFRARHPDWPGMDLLIRRGEAVIPENDDPGSVIAYFAGIEPQTGLGTLRLAEAYAASGNAAAAEREALRAWRGMSLTAEEQAEFLARFAPQLAEHHGGRMAAMLDAGEIADARRMLDLVTPGTRAVAEARIALQAREDGVDAKIEAVPDYMAASGGGSTRISTTPPAICCSNARSASKALAIRRNGPNGARSWRGARCGSAIPKWPTGSRRRIS